MRDDVWNLTPEEATERRRSRGKLVATYNPMMNVISEMYDGYKDRPAEERALIDERWKQISDPCYTCKQENERLRAEIAELRRRGK